MSTASDPLELLPPQLPPSVSAAEYDAEIQAMIKSHKRLTAELVKKEGFEKLLGTSESLTPPSVKYLLLLDDCAYPKGPRKTDGIIPLAPDSLLLRKICQYMTTFDPIAVRYTGAEWKRMLETIHESAVQADLPEAGIAPIRRAMLRLDPTGGTLTSMHTPFLKLCIQSGAYSEALPIIDKIIHSFPSQFTHGFDGRFPCSNHQDSSGYITVNSGLTEKINVRTAQEYLLLAAMVCIGLGREKWPDALLYLEMVVLTPNQNIITGFMLEAYRKWLILSLLVHGKPQELAKVLGGQAIRLLKSTSLPYQALVSAFQSGEPKKLHDEIQVGLELWDKDGNLGLVLTLADYIPRFCIIDLSKRYLSIPIVAISKNPQVEMSPEETLDLCEQLISNASINARIDSSSGDMALRFVPAEKNESELFQQLHIQIKRSTTLADFVTLADSKMMTSKEYAKAVRITRAEEQEASKGGDVAMFGGGDEENLMDESIAMDEG